MLVPLRHIRDMLHYGPVLDIVSVIFSGIEFLLGLGECVESVLAVGMILNIITPLGTTGYTTTEQNRL